MALTPQTNEEFLREVNDELRRDELLSFWRRWGRWLIAAVVLGLAAFGGFLFWQHRREVTAGEQGEQLQQAFDAMAQEDAAKAQAPLATLATSGGEGYRALALQAQADSLLGKGDIKGAAARFGAIAADPSISKPFRDVALVRQTATEFDTLPPQTVIERLRPLAVKGSAWFGSAGELVALAEARAGRIDAAGRMLKDIAADETVPQTIRQRVVQLAGSMGVEASPAAAAPVAAAGKATGGEDKTR